MRQPVFLECQLVRKTSQRWALEEQPLWGDPRELAVAVDRLRECGCHLLVERSFARFGLPDLDLGDSDLLNLSIHGR